MAPFLVVVENSGGICPAHWGPGSRMDTGSLAKRWRSSWSKAVWCFSPPKGREHTCCRSTGGRPWQWLPDLSLSPQCFPMSPWEGADPAGQPPPGRDRQGWGCGVHAGREAARADLPLSFQESVSSSGTPRKRDSFIYSTWLEDSISSTSDGSSPGSSQHSSCRAPLAISGSWSWLVQYP